MQKEMKNQIMFTVINHLTKSRKNNLQLYISRKNNSLIMLGNFKDRIIHKSSFDTMATSSCCRVCIAEPEDRAIQY